MIEYVPSLLSVPEPLAYMTAPSLSYSSCGDEVRSDFGSSVGAFDAQLLLGQNDVGDSSVLKKSENNSARCHDWSTIFF